LKQNIRSSTVLHFNPQPKGAHTKSGSRKQIHLHLPLGFCIAINFYQAILYPPVTKIICSTNYSVAILNYALNDTCTFAAFILFFVRINMPLLHMPLLYMFPLYVSNHT